jgi:hypothetical protein
MEKSAPVPESGCVIFCPDQTKLYRELDSYLSKAVELSFLRETDPGNAGKQERSFEVRRIIRAKIDIKFLEDFKSSTIRIRQAVPAEKKQNWPILF